jgi:hypothetical protein
MAGREADHSPSSSVVIKKEWSYTSNTPYIFMYNGKLSPIHNSSSERVDSQHYPKYLVVPIAEYESGTCFQSSLTALHDFYTLENYQWLHSHFF